MNILKGTLFFIGLFVLSRLVPHPPNFTPLIAAVIFLPFISKDKLGMLLPISVMFISDLIIGFHGQMFWVYGGFTLISLFIESVLINFEIFDSVIINGNLLVRSNDFSGFGANTNISSFSVLIKIVVPIFLLFNY